jgi:transposase
VRINLLKQHRGVATRYDKLAVRYEAGVQLAQSASGSATWNGTYESIA